MPITRFPARDSKWWLLTGVLQLLIFLILGLIDEGRWFPKHNHWPWMYGAMAVVSFCAWIEGYRRYRMLKDLPTSKVGSAAQGYVELFGRARQLPDAPVLRELRGRPCCWFRFRMERREGPEWKREEWGDSEDPFLLVDDTGQCVIAPSFAEIVDPPVETWRDGDRRYEEWVLWPDDDVYAIGDFRTVGGARSELDEKREMAELLADWKQNSKGELLERFDLNRDGALDLKEWELARLQARREVRKRHEEVRAGDATNVLRRPEDGRLFLIAPRGLPRRMGQRYVLIGTLHLVLFFAFGALAIWWHAVLG